MEIKRVQHPLAEQSPEYAHIWYDVLTYEADGCKGQLSLCYAKDLVNQMFDRGELSNIEYLKALNLIAVWEKEQSLACLGRS